jgi:tetratricopeptide (TPR) repeat protein
MRTAGLIAIAIVLLCSMAPAQSTPAGYPAAMAHVREGRFKTAIPILEQLLAGTPGDLKARNLLGIALMSSGRRADASAQFQKALGINPRFHPALKNLAVNELAMGRVKDAKAHFEAAAALVPQDPVVRFHLGQFRLDEQRYKEAVTHLEAARDRFPDRYQVDRLLILARVKAGAHAEAIRAGEEMVGRGQQKAEIYNLLAQAYAASGRIQEAYDALRTATRIDPRDETNYLDLMLLCLEHENWDLSLEISEVALQNVRLAYRVRLQRGAVFALKGQLDDAEKEFVAATKAAPKVNLPWVALALTQIEQKKLSEAAQGLRARRAVSPRDFLVNWILAEAIIQDGAEPGSPAEKEAYSALETAIRANPSAAQPRALLAGLLVKRSELVRAAREFEAALKLDPSDAATAYQLAMLYQKTGGTRRAEELFAKVAEARAEDPAKMARRSLVRIIREGSR